MAATHGGHHVPQKSSSTDFALQAAQIDEFAIQRHNREVRREGFARSARVLDHRSGPVGLRAARADRQFFLQLGHTVGVAAFA